MLTVSAKTESTFEPIPEGTYPAVCCAVIDCGVQYNKQWDNRSRKVAIGWEIPGETYKDKDGVEHPRTIFNTYTASLSPKGILRKDLKAWRGRDFTAEELEKFDLKNIVGVPCMLLIIHTEKAGKVFANIGGVLAMPKGMPKPQLSGYATIFDLDTDPLEDIEKLPTWIGNLIKQSETYMDRAAGQIVKESAGEQEVEEPTFTPLDDDSEDDLPF